MLWLYVFVCLYCRICSYGSVLYGYSFLACLYCMDIMYMIGCIVRIYAHAWLYCKDKYILFVVV